MFHFPPTGECDGRDPEDQNVLCSCLVHFCWARSFLVEKWAVEKAQQEVGDCCFGTSVNHGLRLIDIVRRINCDEWWWSDILVRLITRNEGFIGLGIMCGCQGLSWIRLNIC